MYMFASHAAQLAHLKLDTPRTIRPMMVEQIKHTEWSSKWVASLKKSFDLA
jgi:hypothetical protein